ncbi:DUF1456 family protein [Chitinimonas taiwanensis]|uniref:Uncharacterized conserved protein YehS, DUF1456 family n=1 Tax=Chitinimonas taiwanensis DSM 18899 TaxID=1121279 RepID=A0A1K2HSF9_9NEIS|nr:DUF1456 family protein [Chitinimonas taiwanensis]SFZ79489.1 Uncharacterized conserved protein YehS, DUF1456 family [Chitinimonas taiwanensis DSM 18899]
MIHNDVLRSIRYILDISDARMADIIKLGGLDADKFDVIAYLKRDEEPGYLDCPDEVIAHFLDGLVVHKRGRDESRPQPPIELPVYNNTVLKKLRVAFELREEDILAIIEQAGFQVSKPELSALFRKPDHKNYRRCGDQFLRNFLKGLTLRLRPETR